MNHKYQKSAIKVTGHGVDSNKKSQREAIFFRRGETACLLCGKMNQEASGTYIRSDRKRAL